MDKTASRDKIVTLNFMALFGAVFFLFFALDFFIPVLPFYVLEIGAGETAVGMLMGLFTFCSVVLRPFQGRNLNRRGRKQLLIFGISLYAISGLGLLFMPSLAWLFLFRAIQGLGWGAFLLAFNTLALDLAPPGRKGETVGLFGIAPPFSLATAPFLGEYLRLTTTDNYRLLFVVATAAAIIALVLAVVFREPHMDRFAEKKQPLLSRQVLFPSMIIFFMTFNLGGILTFLPLLGEAREIHTVGSYFTVFALTVMVTRPVAGRLSDHLGRPGVYLPGLFIASTAMVILAVAATPVLLLVSAFIFGIGFGSAHSAVMAMAADRLSVVERGVGMATFTASFDLGIVAGSVILGLLLSWLDFRELFVIGALAMVLPILIYLVRYRIHYK